MPKLQPADDGIGSTVALMTLTDAARRLSLSTSTVRRAIDAGELRASRFGRAIRISGADLASYVAAHRFVAPAPPDARTSGAARTPGASRQLRRRLLDAERCS